MPSYAAFIGHQPAISLAELAAVIPGYRILKLLDTTAVVFESSEAIAPELLDQLGGTVILAEQVAALTDPTMIPGYVSQHFLSLSKRGKLTFSYRCLGLPPKTVKELYRKTKDLLRKAERASRYVGSDRTPAPAIVLHENEMLTGKHGAEMTVLHTPGTDREPAFTWIGRSIAAQDVEAYTARDMQKPVRDTTVGLLPPKLAQVMLNLGQWLVESGQASVVSDEKKQKNSKLKSHVSSLLVLDPFCGTGVIPLECLVRGWGVLASDSSAKAITGCEKNIEWIRKERKILKKEVPSTVWKQDARKAFDLKQLPHVVVTETSLGPNLRNRPTQKEAISLRSDAEKLEIEFLENAAESLPGVPLVVTFPVWYASKSPLMLERVLKAAEKLGYTITLPPGIRGTAPDRPTLLYRRPNQFVGREIVLLKPKKAEEARQ